MLCNTLYVLTLHKHIHSIVANIKLGTSTSYHKFTVALMISTQDTLGQTLREVKPTFFFGVPRYFLVLLIIFSSLLPSPSFFLLSPFTYLSYSPPILLYYYQNDNHIKKAGSFHCSFIWNLGLITPIVD